jgi:predicted site-specific integrase-resolvase
MVVINESKEDEEDLIQDFVSVITSFCAKLKIKKEIIIQELKKNDKV